MFKQKWSEFNGMSTHLLQEREKKINRLLLRCEPNTVLNYENKVGES